MIQKLSRFWNSIKLHQLTIPDPIKHCLVYKSVGCAHVDGPWCDMSTCNIKANVEVTPTTMKEIKNGND